MLIWEPVKGDGPVSTRTFEKPLHAIVPMEVMLFADAGLQRLEVGVGTLHRPTQSTRPVRALKEGPAAALRVLHTRSLLGLDQLIFNDGFFLETGFCGPDWS